ncbi:MAG: TldD/PmbA family protein [Bacillota bacterium]
MNFKPLFEKAKNVGFEAVQVKYSESKSIDLEVFKGELDKHEISDSKTLTIEGIYEGKMGKLSTENIDESRFDDWVDMLKASAEAVESKDPVVIYEGDESYKDVEGVYSEALETLSVEAKKKIVFELEDRVRNADERIDISEAFYSESNKHVRLENSKGLNLEKRVNHAVLGAHVVAKSEDDSRSAFDYIQSNQPQDFDTDALIENVVERGTSMLGAAPIESGKYDVIIENRTSASLLGAFLSMFKAENVQKGLSKLKGKLNESIAASSVSLTEDPYMAKSPKSTGFDGEGVATHKKSLIDKGILNTYMHNLKTAKKDNVQSTGNGFGGGISPTNLYIEPGNKSLETMLETMGSGLFITSLQGLHSGTSAISGDFSLQASGYVVENGKLGKPVSLITLSSNYLELLKSIETIGADLKFTFSYLGSPSLKINKMSVSGK